MIEDYSTFNEDPTSEHVRFISMKWILTNFRLHNLQDRHFQMYVLLSLFVDDILQDYGFDNSELFIGNNQSRLNPRMPVPVRQLQQELGDGFNPDNFFNSGSDVGSVLDESLLGNSKVPSKSLVIDAKPRTPFDLIQVLR